MFSLIIIFLLFCPSPFIPVCIVVQVINEFFLRLLLCFESYQIFHQLHASRKEFLNVFPEGLMVDMASKIFQTVLCPRQLFQWKLICTFNHHCLSYTFSNRQFNYSLFSWKLFETVLHWHRLFQDVQIIQKTFKYIKTDTYIFYGPYSRAS